MGILGQWWGPASNAHLVEFGMLLHALLWLVLRTLLRTNKITPILIPYPGLGLGNLAVGELVFSFCE